MQENQRKHADRLLQRSGLIWNQRGEFRV